MKKILLWAAMLVLTVALASSASAADLTAMDERIAEMANELSEIRSSVQKGSGPFPSGFGLGSGDCGAGLL